MIIVILGKWNYLLREEKCIENGGIHKPRGQLRGRGISQLYYISLIRVKVSTNGVKKYRKIQPSGLWMAPI